MFPINYCCFLFQLSYGTDSGSSLIVLVTHWSLGDLYSILNECYIQSYFVIGVFISCYANALGWMQLTILMNRVIIASGNGLVLSSMSHYLSQCWLIPMSPWVSYGNIGIGIYTICQEVYTLRGWALKITSGAIALALRPSDTCKRQ